MVDILHRIGVTSAPDDVYAALTTVEGLAGWWTEDAAGDGSVGGAIRFGFEPGEAVADHAAFEMKVLEAQAAELVRWEVTAGPPEWIGTEIRFELKQEDGFTIVLFRHGGWKEPVEFMNHCSTKWATFPMSLKRFVETGTGEPSPHDVQISNWH